MSKPIDPKTEQTLDQETLELLGNELQSLLLPPERMKKLRARVMERIDDEVSSASAGFVTIRSNEGPWIEIAPLIHKKVLHTDPETGVEAYLLRAEPGAVAPPHEHDYDEYCVVLEGEVDFDEIHLEAGDYHFAPRGSVHSTARTQKGALLYLQTALTA